MPSIKEKLERRKDLFVRYLNFHVIQDACCDEAVFSGEEEDNIRSAGPAQNEVLLQILMAKVEEEGDGALDGFVGILKGTRGYEYLASLCYDDELDEELTKRLQDEERWERAIEPCRPAIRKSIIERMQIKPGSAESSSSVCGRSLFFSQQLKQAGILELDRLWDATVLEKQFKSEEVADKLVDEACRQLKLGPFVRYLLAEENPKLLLEIENRAASALAELSLSPCPPLLAQSKPLTNTTRSFGHFVQFLNFFDPVLKRECCSNSVLSETEFKKIEASGLNRSRACLRHILAKAGQDPGILERFAGVLRETGRGYLALIIEGDPDGKSAEKLWMENRYKQLINQPYQHRSTLVGLLVYQLRTKCSASPMSVYTELSAFFDELEAKGIIKVNEDAELLGRCFYDQADWMIDTARELFKTPELIDYLLSVVQKPEDKKFLSALRASALVGLLVYQLRTKCSASPMSVYTELSVFFDGLKKEGIITIDGREEAELRKGGFFNQANWVINKAREPFKTPELVDYLLGVLQKPEDKKFLSALKDSALQSSCSSVVVPDENEENARLLQSTLKKIKEAVEDRERILQKEEARLKAAEEKMARAETEGQEALEAARREKATVVEKFIAKIALADERVAESRDDIAGIDIAVWCDHCTGFPGFPGCFDKVWGETVSARHLELVKAVDVSSDEHIHALCAGLSDSDQMDVLRIRAARDAKQKEACQAEFRKLKASRVRLLDALIVDSELLGMSRSMIPDSDYIELIQISLQMQHNRAGKFLDALERGIGNSGDSSSDKLKFFFGAIRRGRVRDCFKDGYKDDEVEQLNASWLRDIVELGKSVDRDQLGFGCWCRILDKAARAGILTERRADQLKQEGFEKTSCERLLILIYLLLPGLDAQQICKFVRIVNAEHRGLGERLTTDKVREYQLKQQNQFNQYLTRLAFRVAAATSLALNTECVFLYPIITKLFVLAFGPSSQEEIRQRVKTADYVKAVDELRNQAKLSKPGDQGPDDSELCDQSQSTGNEPMLIDCLKAKRKLSVFLENRAEVPKPDDSELCDQSQSTDSEPMLIDGEPSETDGAKKYCLF